MRVVAFVSLSAVAVLSAELVAQPTTAPPDTAFLRAVREARLIFSGVVVSRDSGRLRVLAEDIVRTPKAVGRFSQRVVTVLTSDLAGADSGLRAAFFAYGVALGTQMRLREVRREALSGPSALSALITRVAVADSINTNIVLRAQALQADAVVIARIDSLQPIIVSPTQARQRSEHSPNWVTTWVSVSGTFIPRDSALLGRKLRVLSAPGQSLALTPAPSLGSGDRRIFLLRRAGRLASYNRVGIDTAGAFFAFVPDNIRSASDSARLVLVLQ